MDRGAFPDPSDITDHSDVLRYDELETVRPWALIPFI